MLLGSSKAIVLRTAHDNGFPHPAGPYQRQSQQRHSELRARSTSAYIDRKQRNTDCRSNLLTYSTKRGAIWHRFDKPSRTPDTLKVTKKL